MLFTEYQHAAQSKYINKSFSLVVGNYTIYWNKITFLLACVAGVRKGRGRELTRAQDLGVAFWYLERNYY